MAALLFLLFLTIGQVAPKGFDEGGEGRVWLQGVCMSNLG